MLHGGGSRDTPVHQSPLPFRIRTFRLSGAVVPSYNSGPNRLKHAHMKRIRRSISNEKSALSWMTPRRYENWFVCLYLWPDASTTSGGARDVWPGVRSNIVSVFLSNTVRSAASKTVTMTVIILATPPAGLETITVSYNRTAAQSGTMHRMRYHMNGHARHVSYMLFCCNSAA